jgi:DNA modification methylase
MAKDKKTDDGSIQLEFPPIRGYPELRWAGKRPLRTLHHYPAQLRDSYGSSAPDGWRNRLYWGDNLQVMAHLVGEFKGRVNLIYIDPPFDSKAEYKKRISYAGTEVASDLSMFEEKQYGDMWASEEYLQQMYERLLLAWSLLHESGSIFLHCDWHANAYLRLILNEVFGANNCRNEIVWCYTGPSAARTNFPRKHDTILYYVKNQSAPFRMPRIAHKSGVHNTGQVFGAASAADQDLKERLESEGKKVESWWVDIWSTDRYRSEMVGYPTQKPELLIQRIIECATQPGELVFDAFMGSGTTQAVATKLGRRFLGSDINLGAVNTTIARLQQISIDSQTPTAISPDSSVAPGFDLYTVNHYDVFRNEVEARPLLMEALGISPGGQAPWDGTREGRVVKVMPINRIATRADLNDILHGVNPKTWERRAQDKPRDPAERITLVCMGHEPDLGLYLRLELEKLGQFKIEVEVLDVLRHGAKLEFKRNSEALVEAKGGKLRIVSFYPMNLLQKLSLERDRVEDWRELVERVQIDWTYDGAVFTPTHVDAPARKGATVNGTYAIPAGAKTIRVRITDLLSESWEGSVEVGG